MLHAQHRQLGVAQDDDAVPTALAMATAEEGPLAVAAVLAAAAGGTAVVMEMARAPATHLTW